MIAGRCSCILRCFAALAFTLASTTVPAQTQLLKVYDVDTTADLIDDNTADDTCHTSSGHCSLRAAVMQANHSNVANLVIQIRVPQGTYLLTRTDGGQREDNYDLDVTAPLASGQQVAILGAGAGRTIIDAHHAARAFYVESGRNVVLRYMTIRNGDVYGDGGAIYNHGTLTIADSTVENNRASLGIGVYGSSGGAIYNDSDATLTLLRTTVRANAADEGGGIYNANIGAIRNSTISANAADDGGGIYNARQVTIVNSTLSGNTATSDGGGIYSDTDVFMYSVSIVDNIADSDHDAASGFGGGLYAEPGARFVVVNSLIARNANDGGSVDNDCDGTFEVYGSDLFGEAYNCAFTGNGGASITFVSNNTIGALQGNGGSTLTHALLAGSEAIDVGPAAGCVDETGTPLSIDQRGAARVFGARCDAGAYEYGAVVDPIFKSGFE